jgi:fused signal recognition particle receptor
MGFFNKFFNKEKKEDLDKGLEKTKEGFFSKISKAVAGKTKVDDTDLDEIEDALIASDMGLDTTIKIISRLEERVAKDKFINTADLHEILKSEISNLLAENNSEDMDSYFPANQKTPYVLMVVGVNGVGKTTTIGKLAYQLKQEGKSVMLGAADTFRAAAVQQLEIWAARAGVPIVSKGQDADPASVAFDTLNSAIAQHADVVIIDTAGRLHNKVNLMNELTKIKRVMEKVIPGAPHDVMLVLDASTGQNAIQQAKEFTKATDVSCLALTKLDGTAKGGVVIGITDQFKIPIRYIGVGEGKDQLQLFNKEAFVNSLFEK